MSSDSFYNKMLMPFQKLGKFLSVLSPKMVVDPVNALLKQTITTVTCDKDQFEKNLEILQTILDKTTAEDVGLFPEFMNNALWAQPRKAPVTYVDIYEDKLVSMGIFILKPGMKLPLHNHPYMHGLLKVIAGTIKITSFSINSPGDEPNIMKKLSYSPITLTASKNDDIFVDAMSKSCLLEPEINNIHEIEGVGGPAAFIDILAPPYNTSIDDNLLRKCTYFKICEEIRQQTFRLEEVPSPTWFWSDSYPYTGPKLNI